MDTCTPVSSFSCVFQGSGFLIRYIQQVILPIKPVPYYILKKILSVTHQIWLADTLLVIYVFRSMSNFVLSFSFLEYSCQIFKLSIISFFETHHTIWPRIGQNLVFLLQLPLLRFRICSINYLNFPSYITKIGLLR